MHVCDLTTEEATSGEFISVKNELLTATDAIVELRREKEAAEEVCIAC